MSVRRKPRPNPRVVNGQAVPAPTPAEIRRECKRFQEGWTERDVLERTGRFGIGPPAWEVPTIHAPDWMNDQPGDGWY